MQKSHYLKTAVKRLDAFKNIKFFDGDRKHKVKADSTRIKYLKISRCLSEKGKEIKTTRFYGDDWKETKIELNKLIPNAGWSQNSCVRCISFAYGETIFYLIPRHFKKPILISFSEDDENEDMYLSSGDPLGVLDVWDDPDTWNVIFGGLYYLVRHSMLLPEHIKYEVSTLVSDILGGYGYDDDQLFGYGILDWCRLNSFDLTSMLECHGSSDYSFLSVEGDEA